MWEGEKKNEFIRFSSRKRGSDIKTSSFIMIINPITSKSLIYPADGRTVSVGSESSFSLSCNFLFYKEEGKEGCQEVTQQ